MEFSFAFLAGVLALLLMPALPPPWLVALLASVGFGLAALIAFPVSAAVRRACRPAAAGTDARMPPCFSFSSSPNRVCGSLVLCGLTGGFLHAAIQAHLYCSDRWPSALAGERVIAQVIIDTIPVTHGDSRSFDGIVTIEKPVRMATPIHVRLNSRAPEVTPHAGERWRLLLTLRPPRARVNPGTTDLERILFRDRVHALGTVVSSSINRRIDSGHRPLDALRERVAAHIDTRVVDRDAAALISALAVGVTGAMSREQWRVFNATGTTHLVAISGLHVTLFAVIAFALARASWSIVLYRFVAWPRETFAAVTGFAAAAVYATLAGLSVPTQRTLIMLGVWLLMRCVARVSPPFHSFAVALLAVLVLDPFAPLASGFWLSFGAMAAIILITSTRFVRRPAVLEALTIQAAVTVALIPFTLASFASVSLVGPLVNLVAIPAMSWIFVPTILLSVVLAPVLPAASDALLRLAASMHDVGWPWLARAADLPWALLHASPPLWWYALAAVSAATALMPWPRMLRIATLIWVLPLVASADSRPHQGGASVTVLDVGEGTAIVVQTAHHVLVYDTGDVYGSDGRMADAVLIPFLRSRGVRKVDTLVLSHLTAANAPGVTALLAEYAVRETLVGGDVRPDFPGVRDCHSAGAWQWDGVRFHALSTSTSASSHTVVCALAFEAAGARILLPGDIDRSAERALISAGGLAADIVIIPRHGSDTASSQEFTRALGAQWAVVSGRRERRGQEKAALHRWRDAGATLLATGDLGAICFRIDPVRGIEGPASARTDSRALWRSPP